MHLETPKKDEDGTIYHQLYNWLKPYLFSAKTLFFITKVTLATVGCTFIHGKTGFSFGYMEIILLPRKIDLLYDLTISRFCFPNTLLLRSSHKFRTVIIENWFHNSSM